PAEGVPGSRLRHPLHELGEAAPRDPQRVDRLADEWIDRRRDVGHVPRRREREDQQTIIGPGAARQALIWRWTNATMRSNMSPTFDRSGEWPGCRSPSKYSSAMSPP